MEVYHVLSRPPCAGLDAPALFVSGPLEGGPLSRLAFVFACHCNLVGRLRGFSPACVRGGGLPWFRLCKVGYSNVVVTASSSAAMRLVCEWALGLRPR